MFDEIGVFYRGLVLGLMIAAPVGPIGLLCIRRSINKGFLIGFTTGLGAACADTIFGAVATFGVAAILEFVKHYGIFIRIVGGSFLLLVAWHTWHDQPRQPADQIGLVKKVLSMARDQALLGTLKAFMSGFVITMTNPVTIFAILAIVAAFGGLQNRLDAATLVAGIFSGSTLWWILLAGGVTCVRGHFTENRILIVNHITAVILAALAAWAMFSGALGFMGLRIGY